MEQMKQSGSRRATGRGAVVPLAHSFPKPPSCTPLKAGTRAALTAAQRLASVMTDQPAEQPAITR